MTIKEIVEKYLRENGYERLDGGTMNVFPFQFNSVGMPEDKAFVICPKCFIRAFEKILERNAILIDKGELMFDWSRVPKL